MRNHIAAAAIAAGALALVTACASSSSSAAAAAAAAAAAKPKASHSASHHPKAHASPACKRSLLPAYIIRDSDPGASIMADEIGATDEENCTSSLADFAATAGQASGECTTIALASSNPGYDVNQVPAPPLRDVIESAGPGC